MGIGLIESENNSSKRLTLGMECTALDKLVTGRSGRVWCGLLRKRFLAMTGVRHYVICQHSPTNLYQLIITATIEQ